MLDIDPNVDAEADESEQETGGNEWKAYAGVIAREGKDQQHDCA